MIGAIINPLTTAGLPMQARAHFAAAKSWKIDWKCKLLVFIQSTGRVIQLEGMVETHMVVTSCVPYDWTFRICPHFHLFQLVVISRPNQLILAISFIISTQVDTEQYRLEVKWSSQYQSDVSPTMPSMNGLPECYLTLIDDLDIVVWLKLSVVHIFWSESILLEWFEVEWDELRFLWMRKWWWVGTHLMRLLWESLHSPIGWMILTIILDGVIWYTDIL
jgi:hypothetical protein